ncbi:MAG TPA: histidine kinase dimerization/phospho-acceptor domain-containing protein [Bacteroidota bacterium]|nr:histidine kinase dimerization/phospho-acceptor domain-containing protein [Bacteroidota bacterium]
METMRVLAIGTSPKFKALLEATPVASEATKFEVTALASRAKRAAIEAAGKSVEAIVFGEHVPSPTVVRFSRTFRSRGIAVPIVVLTWETGNGVPENYRRAGVDDMLNVAEVNSPLFSWAFMSAVRYSETENKLREFDSLQSRLKDANQTLATIAHEINNPLIVIRLALFHLENPEMTKSRKIALFRMLSENVDRVDTQVEQLRQVRRILGDGSAVLFDREAISAKAQKAG